ncbi:MAG: fibronectin type III domain-containing protein [Dehalococcoidia bacterium]|nr:fibronectin type III domain-containing protein [Dehalococcoidia bacterium]
MTTKVRYICALVAGLFLFVLFAPLPVQAASGPLEWASVDKPGLEGNIVVTPSEVSEIAVGDDGVIYAIDREYSKVYRSLNAGVSWEDMTSYLVDAGAELAASKVAVAPDGSGIVAMVTNDGTKIYLSTDSGVEWTDTSVPSLTGTIQAIAISNQYTEAGESVREIAIATAVWGDNASTGQLWILQLGRLWASWQNQDLAVDPGHVGAEVSALAYSLSYRNDRTILVMASTGEDVAPVYRDKTWLCLGERDVSDGTTSWNNLTGYPVEIVSAGDASEVSLIHSSLALPSDYSSEETSSRQLFVSYNREPDIGDDVYWLDDVTVRRMNADGGNVINISGISYHGTVTSGKLLAGDANPVAGSLTVRVRRTSNPFAQSPTWYLSSVPPTGPGNAKVNWSPDGEIAYCGTSQSPGGALDESAFSASLDGDKWRQMGLMDTTIKLADVAPAPDSESLFITTYSSSGPEGIWRTVGYPLGRHWQRLLALDTAMDAVILRLSANYSDDSTIYAAEAGGNLMAVSYNRGNTWRWCRAPGPVIDMVVSDEETVYVALPDGYISKPIDHGWMWQDLVDTGLPDINMLAIAGDGTILVGGRNGDVAYSGDGGDTFIRIPEDIGNGDVQVVADANYRENNIIYAATNTTDEGIWRWVIGVSTEWEQIDKSITELEEEQRIGGLVVGLEGTLYALNLEPATRTSGGASRSLNPAALDYMDVEFDLVNDALPLGATFDPSILFLHILPYLKLSGDAGQNELWAIDTANQTIYRFQDTLCKVGPSLSAPEDETILPVDSCYCDYVNNLFLHWLELSETKTYEADIYLDAEGTQSVWSGSSDDAAIMAVGDTTLAELTSGTTYYWRVRSVEPIKSPWSDIQSFTPSLGAAPVGISPSSGATDVPIRPAFTWDSVAKATSYEFILSEDSEFADVVVSKLGDDALPATAWGCDRELDYSTIYFWKVRGISATSSSEWVTGVFTTEPAPSSAPSSPVSVSPSHSPESVPSIASHLSCIAIGIGVALVAALLILILRTRR